MPNSPPLLAISQLISTSMSSILKSKYYSLVSHCCFTKPVTSSCYTPYRANWFTCMLHSHPWLALTSPLWWHQSAVALPQHLLSDQNSCSYYGIGKTRAYFVELYGQPGHHWLPKQHWLHPSTDQFNVAFQLRWTIHHLLLNTFAFTVLKKISLT